jgi:hypothetical protein
MTMKRNRFALSSLAVPLIGLLLIGSARAQEPQSDTVIFMRQKLALSQGVIEGITLEHYDLVASNARKLFNMTQSNVWVSVKSKGYQKDTQKFQKSVTDLLAAARAQNTTDMLSAWGRTVENCTACHQTFRTEQYVRGHMGKKPKE